MRRPEPLAVWLSREWTATSQPAGAYGDGTGGDPSSVSRYAVLCGRVVGSLANNLPGSTAAAKPARDTAVAGPARQSADPERFRRNFFIGRLLTRLNILNWGRRTRPEHDACFYSVLDAGTITSLGRVPGKCSELRSPRTISENA